MLSTFYCIASRLLTKANNIIALFSFLHIIILLASDSDTTLERYNT
jgi:hypothetical protein